MQTRLLNRSSLLHKVYWTNNLRDAFNNGSILFTKSKTIKKKEKKPKNEASWETTISFAVSAQNECSDTVYKELGNIAKRSPTYYQDSVPLCDRYLVKDWYIVLHHEMPTTAPNLGACGTTFPQWLNGN